MGATHVFVECASKMEQNDAKSRLGETFGYIYKKKTSSGVPPPGPSSGPSRARGPAASTCCCCAVPPSFGRCATSHLSVEIPSSEAIFLVVRHCDTGAFPLVCALVIAVDFFSFDEDILRGIFFLITAYFCAGKHVPTTFMIFLFSFPWTVRSCQREFLLFSFML